jgi:hypothetical protein
MKRQQRQPEQGKHDLIAVLKIHGVEQKTEPGSLCFETCRATVTRFAIGRRAIVHSQDKDSFSRNPIIRMVVTCFYPSVDRKYQQHHFEDWRTELLSQIKLTSIFTRLTSARKRDGAAKRFDLVVFLGIHKDPTRRRPSAVGCASVPGEYSPRQIPSRLGE